jgi:integrase
MPRRATAPFVVDVVDEFLRTKEPKEPKTHASYFGVLRGTEHGTKPSLGTPLAAYFQNQRFDRISDDDVARWFAQRVRNAAQDTKSRMSKQAREFFTFAYERGYSSHNLGRAIETHKPGGPRVAWLEWPDVHRLLEAIPEFHLRMASAWLFYAGCRVGEAIRARQTDLMFRGVTGLYEWQILTTKTHVARSVWLPETLSGYIEASRSLNQPKPEWPVLWDCLGRGFGRVENPTAHISECTINSALRRACEEISLPINVTAHVARHTYCTNWINERGSDPFAMEKLSRQVGASVEVLRTTYVHFEFTEADWAAVRDFGSPV